MNAVISKLKETKPSEMLDHLYVDGNNEVRDKHIEDMWNRLYAGQPLDAIFRNNFCQYHGFAKQRGAIMPASVFDNVIVAKRWIGTNYGTLVVSPFNPDDYQPDADLADKRFLAILRDRHSIENAEHCYSPHELHAALLTVVNVYRRLAHEHVQRLTA